MLGTLLKVDENLLAQHIAHYKQTKLARDKAWAIKAVQSKAGSLPARLGVSSHAP